MQKTASVGALLGSVMTSSRALPARFSRDLPLRAHLAVFAALLLVPAIILAAVLIREFASDRRREAESRVVQLANTTADRISGELERALTILKTLSLSSALATRDYHAFYDQAQRAIGPMDEIIIVVEPNGHQLLNTARAWGESLTHFSSQSDLDQVAATKLPLVTGLFFGRMRSLLVTNVLLPIVEQGDVRLIIALSISADRIRQWLQMEGVAGEWITAVGDRNGLVIARSQDHDQFAGKMIPAELRQAGTGKAPHAAVGLDGRKLVRAIATTRVGGWTVAATVSEEHLQSGVRNAVRNLVLWSLALLGLAAVLVVSYARHMTAAFIEVSDAVKGKPRRGLVREANEAAQRLSGISSELRHSEERFRGIFENAATGIAITYLDGRFQACNPAYTAMLGYTLDDLHGFQFNTLVHPDDSAGNAELMRKLHAEEIPSFEIVNRYVGRGGKVLWVHKHVSLLRRDDGRPTNVIALVTDMTERKRVEQELRASEIRFRATFENAAVGVAQVGPDGRWLRVNARLCEILGYTADALTSKTFQEITHPDDLVADMENVRRIEAGEIDRFALEKRYVRGDGSHVWVNLACSCIRKADGRMDYLIGIIEDITERRHAREHIQLLMREVNHRSKNMLSLVQAVARQTAARNPGEFIASFGDRLQSLAASQDLLVRNSWKGVGLEELARSQVAHFQDLVGSRIKLNGPRLEVTASAAQTIGMAIHELATNAGKYGALSNASGQVQLEWHLVKQEGKPAEFALSWRETGGPSVTEPVKPGFGSTVISNMARMSLGARSDLKFDETGVSWQLRCPADKVLEGGEGAIDGLMEPVSSLAPSGDKPRILLVEDEALTAIELAHLLSEAGFDVLGPANSVAQAMDILDRRSCEAAVLDVNLGRETSEPIANRLEGQQTPFVTVSGYSRSQQPAAFRSAPFVSKPVRADLLLRELHKCLAQAAQ